MTPAIVARELGRLVEIARRQSSDDPAHALEQLVASLERLEAAAKEANALLEERRAASRASLRTVVFNLDHPGECYTTLDISVGGMRVLSPGSLVEGGRLSLGFMIGRETIQCHARVVWCQATPERYTQDRLAGLQLELSSGERRLIQDYVSANTRSAQV